MHALEQWKLDKYKTEVGKLTSEEALTLALEAEQFMKDCGPFDPAFAFFSNQYRMMLDYADLLDKEERSHAG